jgi:predicted ferric reductase
MEMNSDTIALKRLAWVLLGAVLVMCGALVLVANTISGGSVGGWFGGLLGGNGGNITWYITRSSGLIAYLLMWLSTLWGLAVPSKLFDRLLERLFTFDLHEFLSLLALGFTGLHMLVLLFDHYEPFTITQLLIPFLSQYRPVWIAVGIVGLYLTVLVTATFYLRQRIGYKTFRVIHYLSIIGFIAVLAHSVLSGTDSDLWSVRLMYIFTGLSVVFMTVYWLALGLMNKLVPDRSQNLSASRTL